MTQNVRSRIINKKQSDIHVTRLDDERSKTCRRTLLEVIKSSFGPNGKIHMLHNNVGGHVTLTKSSSRLLGALSVKDSIARIVTTSMQSHLSRNPDGGLFVGLFALLLVENSLKLDIHRKLLADIYELLVNKSLKCMNVNDDRMWTNLKLTNVEMTVDYLNSIIHTKAVSCGLQPDDINTLSRLLYKTFLQVCSPSSNLKQLGTIHYLTMDGPPTNESKLVGGVLFEMPSIPVYMKNPLKVKCISTQNETFIRVCLVSASMSGDSEEFIDARYETSYSQNITETVLEKIEHYVGKLIDLQIGLLACQKVVHPRIKKKCRDSGVFVLDRLGAKYISAVEELCGGKLIGSFTAEPDISFMGSLDNVSHVVLHNKSFVHLAKEASNVVTVLVCAKSEQLAEEIKNTAKCCIESLEVMLRDSRILYGAGCWITVLSRKLSQTIEEAIDQHCLDLSCTERQLYIAMETFIQSLLQVTIQLGHPDGDKVIDSLYHHFWSTPVTGKGLSELNGRTCMCGCIRNTPGFLTFKYLTEHDGGKWVNYNTDEAELASAYSINSCDVWDSFEVYKNALPNAVFTANLLLTLQSSIQDTN